MRRLDSSSLIELMVDYWRTKMKIMETRLMNKHAITMRSNVI